MTNKKERNACPKCKSNSLTIHGNNTGYTITDIHSEYFEIFRCNACGFEFSTDSNNEVGVYLTIEMNGNLARNDAEQIIHLMSGVIGESNNELIKNDFKRLSDRLMKLTRYVTDDI